MIRTVIRNVRQSADNYIAVLVLMASILFVAGALPTYQSWTDLVVSLLAMLAVLLSLHASRVPAGVFWFAVALCAVWLLSAVFGHSAASPLTFTAIAFLLFIAPVAILSRIVRHRRVTIRTVAGAVCVYLQIGLAFSLVFRAIALADPAALAMAPPVNTVMFNYYSFITLTTVGYGDIRPVSNFARTIALIEALIGQIFLVVIVARVVALLGQDVPASDSDIDQLRSELARGHLDPEALPPDPGEGGAATR